MIALSVAARTVGFICLSWAVASVVTAVVWHCRLRHRLTPVATSRTVADAYAAAVELDEMRHRLDAVAAEHEARQAHRGET